MCHQLGLYHGLLKPSNLLIDHDGRLRLLDCGIGCLLGHSPDESMVDTMSTANAIVAGLDCASPERIADPKEVTPLGDQYSLGCVMYYLLTGRFPFPGKAAVEKMVGHQLKQATPVRELEPTIPEELAEVVARLMQKDPAARYPSCLEVVEALRPSAEIPKRRVSRPVPTIKTPVEPAPRPVPKRQALTLPSALAAHAERPLVAEAAPAMPSPPIPSPQEIPSPPQAIPVKAKTSPSPKKTAVAKPPVSLFLRILAFVVFIACAGFLQFAAEERWFAFAGEHARLIPKALASTLVTAAVLVLMLPRANRRAA
jgi:serine/threonine protein kinase